jgi:hypothetical protein
VIIAMKKENLLTRVKWFRCYNTNQKKYRKAIKILISIVIGSLLLAGLYTLFGDLILPKLTERINQMFNFAG